MLFFDLLYFLCISLSISTMWSFSEIFAPLRNIVSRIPYIRKPLICPECASFWIGVFASFIYNPIKLNLDFYILSNLICGLVTYLFAHFFYDKKKVDNKINFIK
jgi:hypothetical protein